MSKGKVTLTSEMLKQVQHDGWDFFYYVHVLPNLFRDLCGQARLTFEMLIPIAIGISMTVFLYYVMIQTFNQDTFQSICDDLAARDADLAAVINAYGYPPMWSRPNTFETLVHIILEQQVSLASALSALNKLKESIQEITPVRVLLLTDDELRACYFSRQKTAYVRYLAEAIVSGQINLESFINLPDDVIRSRLTSLKGIGNWTVDVYLMFVLQRADIFPAGDLAAVNALKKVKRVAVGGGREQLIAIAEQWKPYRTVATMLLWHFYLASPKSSPKERT